MYFDCIIRNGTLVSPEGERVGDLVISAGKIAATGDIAGSAEIEVDATGKHVFAGVIDSHVHFNEPGRTEWEGIATGSLACAVGGTTCFFDMPLNASPPTLDGVSFDLKLAAMRDKSRVDFALWGGLTPNNLDQLESLAERGVIAFKAFMSDSGIDDFTSVDDATLRKGMKRVAALNRLIAVHAESEAMTSRLSTEARRAGRKAVADYLVSRPIAAEVEAIRRACEFAGEAGCILHIVHVSSAAGVAEVVAARSRGVDVTCETCPHYLLFCDADVERLGACAKCAPPMRTKSEVEQLWHDLATGRIDFVASDHSPAPGSMKTSDDFFAIWGGIAGCQSLLPAMLAEGGTHGLTLPQIAALTSSNVAKRYGIAHKGTLAVGQDADLAIVDLNAAEPLTPEHLHYRHPISPYLGLPLHGSVRHTMVRGQFVVRDGEPAGRITPQLIRPELK